MLDFDAANGFTIERLRTFCRIAEAGSISAAAKADVTRQSQYSRQMKELEEFLGTKLLVRTGKTLSLTSAGRKLALLTLAYFRSVQELRAASTQEDVLRVGAGESVFRWIIMPRLSELQSRAGNTKFEFLTQSTRQAIDGVKAGRLDLAVVRGDAVDDSLSALPCGLLKYVLVVPRNLLPEKTAAGIQMSEKIPFAMLTGDGVLANGILQLATKADVNLDIQVKAENFSLLLAAIENGNLAAVIPEPALADLSQERFATVALKGIQTLSRDLVLVFSPQAAELRENIRRQAPRISELMYGVR